MMSPGPLAQTVPSRRVAANTWLPAINTETPAFSAPQVLHFRQVAAAFPAAPLLRVGASLGGTGDGRRRQRCANGGPSTLSSGRSTVSALPT